MTHLDSGLLPLTLYLLAAPERAQVGLLAQLATVASIAIVGQAPSLSDLALLASTGAEALLVDLYGGVEPDYTLLASIRRQYPAMAIVVLAPRHRRGILDRLYRLGASAFVTEDVGLVALVDALHTIHNNPNIFIVRIGG
jgi:DNA-binding NarL/FixJ family response regulator